MDPIWIHFGGHILGGWVIQKWSNMRWWWSSIWAIVMLAWIISGMVIYTNIYYIYTIYTIYLRIWGSGMWSRWDRIGIRSTQILKIIIFDDFAKIIKNCQNCHFRGSGFWKMTKNAKNRFLPKITLSPPGTFWPFFQKWPFWPFWAFPWPPGRAKFEILASIGF